MFDTHAHLTDPQLEAIRDELLHRAAEAGIEGMVAVATDAASSLACLKMAEQYERVFASVGIHPNDCHQASSSEWDAIRHLARQSKVVAIGETGLDRHWDTCPIELQNDWFDRHISLSFELNKPLIIHMRDCEEDILQSLGRNQREGQILGIMHSFTGKWETAKTCLDLGMYISFAGMVTFKNAADLREIAARIPSDRLLIETDAPYLTPHPHRGKRPNEPAMVRFTAECLAQCRGESVEELQRNTTNNAHQIFRLPDQVQPGKGWTGS